MKCADIQSGRVGPDEPGRRDHVAGCSACAAALARSAAVACLVALKRYEQPDPTSSARCLAGIRHRIRAREETPPTLWEQAREWLNFEPLPALRVAVATGAILLAAFYLWLPRPALLPAPRLTQAPAVSQPLVVGEPQFPVSLAGDTNPVLVLTPTSAVPSKIGRPGGIQYGPGETRPVNYDY